MANIITVTRPYAKAILSLARADKSYAQWSVMLHLLAQIAQDTNGYKILSNLAISSLDKAKFICEVAGDRLNDQGKSLVKLLARSKRLLILPELYSLYEEMRKKEEGLLEIDLKLAQALNQNELESIRKTSANNLGVEVILHDKVVPELIGGGVAVIGNRVVDASIIGRLHAMRNLLKK